MTEQEWADQGLRFRVTKAEGEKCPRCWRICGVPSNYEGCCDDCCGNMLAGLLDYVARGSLTPEAAEEMRCSILRRQMEQLFLFRRDLMAVPEARREQMILAYIYHKNRARFKPHL